MGYVFRDQYGVVTAVDEDKLNEPKEIRFITPEYRDLFRIPDGGSVLFCTRDGKRREVECKYLDDYHLLFGKMGAYHICELAERLQRGGCHVEPFPEKRMVWSNRDLDLKDWIDELRVDFPNASRDELYERMVEWNDSYLDDEYMNLDIHVGEDIIAIADLGRWNGRHMGYKEYHSDNLRNCLEVLSGCEFNEWYVDRDGEFRSTQSHHDGTNYLFYRKWKRDATDEQREELLDIIYNGEATALDIDALTDKLGRDVGMVYGWEFPNAEKSPLPRQQKER